jgi:DNA-binding MarR family transcriptional regulator
MSSRLPRTTARERPENLGILLREAFVALNDLALARLVERGHGAVRPTHGAVFQYLDDAGTTVSVLAERAQMTKQSMAELVRHLEAHGYVERVPDPTDRRAKLVKATDRGRHVFAIVREFVTETEERLIEVLGAARMSRLRDDLQAVRETVGPR